MRVACFRLWAPDRGRSKINSLSWVSESLRQVIGQFLSPCKSADYFIKARYEARFQLGKYFYY